MKRLLVLAVILRAAPAHADCVDLPGRDRVIDMPAGWRVPDEGDETYLHFFNDAFLADDHLVTLGNPHPEVTCSAIEDERSELERPPGFSAAYARYWSGSSDSVVSCLDTPRGALNVMVWTNGLDLGDPRWLAITSAIADAMLFDLECTLATSSTPTPSTGRKPLPRLRADLSAAIGRSRLVTDLALGLGGSFGPLWFGVDLRFGRGLGGFEGGVRLGAVFGERPRIATTFGLSGRSVASNSALGLGFKVAASYPLPKRLEALASVDLGWQSKTLEFTVPEPRTERGPFERELSALLGVGWRFLFAGFETRALPEYDQRTYALVLGARYAN